MSTIFSDLIEDCSLSLATSLKIALFVARGNIQTYSIEAIRLLTISARGADAAGMAACTYQNNIGRLGQDHFKFHIMCLKFHFASSNSLKKMNVPRGNILLDILF